ncbi:MAG TPA: hypothetical protein VK826_17955, partial [Bacteroidia bacterium]|nr:hypothetical protein [Bacteroidia bacterium]
PEAPKKKRNTTLIVVLVVAILAILAGAAIPTLTYMHDHNESGLTTSNFTLAYENPTDKEFVIILDDWDTIKVAPYSASENLEYTIRRDQQTLHWKMLDASGKTIADTTVEKDAITSWFYDNGWADKYDEGKILLNPSRSQFVTYTVWLLEDGKDYAQDVVIGDSTYSVDAIVTTSAFIFDVRTPDEITSLDGSNPYGSLERNQYLVSARDFMVLYKNLSGNDGPIAKFRAYKDHLDELVALSRAELLSSSNTSYQDEQKVDELDNLIPYVTASTVPRDFVPAIDYVRAHTTFFSDLNYKQYKIVDDSADTVLKNAYGVKPRPESFPALHYLSFSVERNGLMGDEAHRKIDYELDRDEEGGGIY